MREDLEVARSHQRKYLEEEQVWSMENPQGNRIGIMLKKKEGDVQGKTRLGRVQTWCVDSTSQMRQSKFLGRNGGVFK